MIARRRPLRARRAEAAKKRRAASAHQGLKFPKGATRAAAKGTRARARAEAIALTRHDVWRRSAGRCEACRATELDTARRIAVDGQQRPSRHELHEALVSRAEGRGLPPRTLFNAWNCCRLCPFCHVAATRHRIDLVPVDWSEGCAGGVEAQLRLAGVDPTPPLLAVRVWLAEAFVRRGDAA